MRHVLLAILASMLMLQGLAASAQDAPDRALVAAFEYPRQTIEEDDEINLALILKNNGTKDETVLLEITKAPAGWDCELKSYSDVVSGVFVPSEETKRLTLAADERDGDDMLKPGAYTFEVRATTEDGQLTATASAQVAVKQKTKEEKETEDQPVRIETTYPMLRGSSESDFQFSIDIYNETDKDDMFTLRAEAPEAWDVSFKPSYENKYIGSLEIKSNMSKSVNVEIDPPARAETGEYPVTVYAKCSEGEAERQLTVVLTGTHRLSVRTVNDVLSLRARKGESANASIYVINEGTATQQEITFTSFKPENWTVEFEPQQVDNLAAGDMRQVEVTITPAAEALVGDYSVAVTARGEEADDDIEFRVTVRASATWAWAGVIVIILVIVGLATMFKVLGRR